MPNQPPSDRTRARGEPPSPDFWLLTSGFSPIMQNEPKKTTPDAIGPPLYLTLTEVGDTPTTQNHETNPISSRRHPQKCETNPISSRSLPKIRNEPNFRPDGPVEDQNTRNEPNPRTSMSSRTYSPRCVTPTKNWCGKTNPIYAPQLCETNPISTGFGLPQSTIYILQSTIPWPNLPQ